MDTHSNNILKKMRKAEGEMCQINCINCLEIINDLSLRSKNEWRSKSRIQLSIKRITQSFSMWIFCTLLILCSCFGHVSAVTVSPNDDTTEDASSEEEEEEEEENHVIKSEGVIPKAVITVGGMVVFVLLGISISKLVDYCYDRHAISDDASDISDYTKEILKAQLMLAFSKTSRDGKEKLTPDQLKAKYVKIWRAKVARNKARSLRREKTMAEVRGTYRPSSSRVKSAKAVRTPASVNVINERTLRPASKTRIVAVSSFTDADAKKGASRPISAGLKSRPTSARSFKFVPRAGKRS